MRKIEPTRSSVLSTCWPTTRSSAGRLADERELLIGRGSHGYVALYRYIPLIDTALILAVRAQREAGYADR